MVCAMHVFDLPCSNIVGNPLAVEIKLGKLFIKTYPYSLTTNSDIKTHVKK